MGATDDSNDSRKCITLLLNLFHKLKYIFLARCGHVEHGKRNVTRFVQRGILYCCAGDTYGPSPSFRCCFGVCRVCRTNFESKVPEDLLVGLLERTERHTVLCRVQIAKELSLGNMLVVSSCRTVLDVGCESAQRIRN